MNREGKKCVLYPRPQRFRNIFQFLIQSWRHHIGTNDHTFFFCFGKYQLNISLEIYKLINTELIPAENRVYPCEYTIFLIFLIF